MISLFYLTIIKSYNLTFVTWIKLQTYLKLDIYVISSNTLKYSTTQEVAKILKKNNFKIFSYILE